MKKKGGDRHGKNECCKSSNDRLIEKRKAKECKKKVVLYPRIQRAKEELE